VATKYQIITKQGGGGGEAWSPITTIGEAEISDPVVLGGKGAGLNAMVCLGLPVPDGFTIHTEACVAYQLKPKGTYCRISGLAKKAYKALKTRNGGIAPIVSVRSGAEKPMPGMLSTVLNVGLTTKTFPKLAKRFGDKVAFDCKRRLIQSYGTVVLGIPSKEFEDELLIGRQAEEVETDGELSAKMLEHLTIKFTKTLALYGQELPDTIGEQLTTSIRAVFESWNNPEAIHWRSMHGVPEDGGTAVNVQTMVFGNVNENSGTGVLFTRDPSTGKNAIFGEWMPNAQGEDLVAGVRTPQPISDMMESFKEQFSELLHRADLLEKTYRDMRDIEFTVEDGKLWMLQDRAGERSDEATARIAVELVEEETLTKAEAIGRVSASTVTELRGSSKEIVSPDWTHPHAALGLPASPGIVTGRIAYSAEAAIEMAKIGPVILVRDDTKTSDIAGMDAAVGVLTETGGVTSHAAVCSRALNTACIVGCKDVSAAIALANAKLITLDGSTGKIWFDAQVPVESKGANPSVEKLLQWAFEEAGVQRQTSVLSGHDQRVMCIAWVGDKGGRDKSFETLSELSHPSTVVFDLSGPGQFNREEDAGLTTMFGEDSMESDDSSMHLEIDALADHHGRGAMVYLPGLLRARSPELRKAGYKVALDVTTMADVFESDGLITVEDEMIEKLFGHYSALEKTMSLLKNAGTPVEILQPATSEADVIEKFFGKES
jgi:pyruvate,orthophosphate dikinase